MIRAMVLLTISYLGFAQVRQIQLNQISTDQGLSQSTVYAVTRDSYGFLWVGTYDGLNRYDGREFKHFARSNSFLPDNLIRSLWAGSDGNLWIGTGSFGLVRHRIGTAEFEQVTIPGQTESNTEIQSILSVAGHLAVLTDGSLYWVDGHPYEVDHQGDIVAVLAYESHLWFGDSNGRLHIHRFDASDRFFTCALLGLEDGEQVSSLANSGSAHALVGTSKGRLLRVRRDGQIIDNYTELLKEPSEIENLLHDSNGYVWVSQANIDAFVLDLASATRIELAETNYFGEWIYAMYEDAQNIVWMGTYGSGLLKFDTTTDSVKFYRGFSAPGSVDDVTALCHVGGLDLAFGTHNGGFFVVDETWGTPKLHHRLDGQITVIAPTGSGEFMVGTSSGLHVINESGARRHVHSAASAKGVSAICEYQGDLLVSTNGDGIFRYRNDQLVHHYDASRGELPSNRVWELICDRNQRLWVGTVEGLAVKRLGDESFTVFRAGGHAKSLPHNTVDAIREDNEGNILIGTTGGLAILAQSDVAEAINKPEQASFTVLDTRAGLPSDAIFAVLEDESAAYWISTSRGIARYETNSGRVTCLDRSDGLQGYEFNSGCALKLPDGKLVFGGVKGINVIDPPMFQFKREPSVAPLITQALYNERQDAVPIDGFKLEAMEIPVGQALGMFIDFSLLDLRRPDRFQFFWRLDGLHDTWLPLSQKRSFEITSLNSGDYVLRLKTCFSNVDCLESHLSLPIRVIPSIWERTWMRVLLVVLAAALLNGLYFVLRAVARAMAHWRRTMFIGPYKVIQEIGKGGMGTVYKAQDVTNHDMVALKVLDQFVPDDTRKKRFLQESMICETLQHPNIVRIFNKGEHSDRVYFAMECVDGVTLRQWIDSEEVSPQVALMMIAILKDALNYMHGQGVVHRDFKPENIMIDRSITVEKLPVSAKGLAMLGSSVRLLDFGLAKAVGYESITRTGVLAGTVSYLPPEYISGQKEVGPYLDFYALGIILYELLTGAGPFPGSDYVTLIYSIMKRKPDAACDVNPDVPQDVSDFTMALIERVPNARLMNSDEIDKWLTGMVERYVLQPEAAAPTL
ncbi:MAG: protein kinase [Acidobacteria bacterium]|nr:protein kinase [Acidobacteriota bacterium]